MDKEERKKYIFAQLRSLPNATQYVEVTKYIENLEQQVKKQKEVIDRLNFIKNRKNQGASQENINKMAIKFVNSYLKEAQE